MDSKKAETLLTQIAQYDLRKGQLLYPELEAAIMSWPKLARDAMRPKQGRESCTQ
jgi:hypothetical protein